MNWNEFQETEFWCVTLGTCQCLVFEFVREPNKVQVGKHGTSPYHASGTCQKYVRTSPQKLTLRTLIGSELVGTFS